MQLIMIFFGGNKRRWLMQKFNCKNNAQLRKYLDKTKYILLYYLIDQF
jgi:hypothetical protein